MLIYPVPANVCFRLVQIQFFCISRLAFLRSHSIDICTVAIKSLKNIYAVSTNQIADILHFNNQVLKSYVKIKL